MQVKGNSIIMAIGREEIQTVFCAVKYKFNAFLSLKYVGSIYTTFWAQKSYMCYVPGFLLHRESPRQSGGQQISVCSGEAPYGDPPS